MKVNFRTAKDSIGPFDPVDLPPFAVITGLNGAGKTHLMNAIKAGNVQVDAIPVHEIAYYNYHDFVVPSSQTLNSQQITSHRDQTWQFFNGVQGNPKVNWRSQLNVIHNQHFVINENGQPVDKLVTELPEGVSIWDAYKDSSLVNPWLGEKIRAYVTAVKQQVFANANFKKIPYHLSLMKALRKTDKCLHLVSEDDFREKFIPSTQSTNHLTSSLGVIFTKYKVNQFLWAHKKWDDGDNASTKNQLFDEYEKLHEKPWNVVNEILEEIHRYAADDLVFNFSITKPDDTRLKMENWQTYSFTPTLIDKNDGVQRQFNLLSSGEQVLLALAISIYEARDDFTFPELLLLDEIDASLHPSMTRALLETLQSTFVRRGTNVILATHSPSTVALAPEDSVFVVHKGRPKNKIEPSTKKNALEFLTEGFATLEHGLAIFNEIAKHDICIITEGKNTNYIKRALKIFGQTDVEVVSGLEAVTGKDQLKTLFRLFCDAPIAKPVLFVWDCDVKYQLSDTNNAYPLILPQNTENNVCARGIENMFPDYLFNEFTSETTDSHGVTTRQFDPKRKSDFEQHVLANAADADFGKFQSLINKIETVRGVIAT